MKHDSTTMPTDGIEPFSGDAWFDPIETGIRDRVRGFIDELLEEELTQALGRSRHERTTEAGKGQRNGTGERQWLGSFGAVRMSVPRARRAAERGGTEAWRSLGRSRYARMT